MLSKFDDGSKSSHWNFDNGHFLTRKSLFISSAATIRFKKAVHCNTVVI